MVTTGGPGVCGIGVGAGKGCEGERENQSRARGLKNGMDADEVRETQKGAGLI